MFNNGQIRLKQGTVYIQIFSFIQNGTTRTAKTYFKSSGGSRYVSRCVCDEVKFHDMFSRSMFLHQSGLKRVEGTKNETGTGLFHDILQTL